MPTWAQRVGAVMAQQRPWYEPDAQLVWVASQDTDTTAMDPIVGASMPKQSTAAATISGSDWDMTGSVYGGGGAVLTQSIDMSKPFLFACILDKNNQASSTARLIFIGNEATYSVSFGTGASGSIPEFRFFLAGVSQGPYVSQATWSAKGTSVCHWFDYDPTDATNTVLVGANTTQNASSAVLTIAGGATLGRNLNVGNSSGTSGLSAIKQRSMQFISRAGLTRAQKATIIANMRTQAGI